MAALRGLDRALSTTKETSRHDSNHAATQQEDNGSSQEEKNNKICSGKRSSDIKRANIKNYTDDEMHRFLTCHSPF